MRATAAASGAIDRSIEGDCQVCCGDCCEVQDGRHSTNGRAEPFARPP